ncbi:MAG: HD domain-containing phosphohydrolase [Gemmatimonadota bacterium]
MHDRRRFFARWTAPKHEHGRSAGSAQRADVGRVESEMASALRFALEFREGSSQIVEHSSRVARLASQVASLVDVDYGEMAWLRAAAQLHEIGMVAVPADLLTRSSRLTPEELARVRAQAAIGAEIVRPTHGAVTARLIEQQYHDYEELRQETSDTRTLLLAGILRVVDVFDAMTAPRPYQTPVPEERWRQVLRFGSGAKFHPAAVYALLQLVGSAGPVSSQ